MIRHSVFAFQRFFFKFFNLKKISIQKVEKAKESELQWLIGSSLRTSKGPGIESGIFHTEPAGELQDHCINVILQTLSR